MTDRELLERAARAAGITGVYRADWGAIERSDRFDSFGRGDQWRPHRDDADAFRLRVSAGLDVEWCSSGRVSAYRHANANGHCFTAMESYREDRAAATRRAIVRAAAEMAE